MTRKEMFVPVQYRHNFKKQFNLQLVESIDKEPMDVKG
jgi:hypothetical protein